MTWYNSSWNYRKAITISNSGSTLSNYQTLVIVDTAILISSSKMRSDCGDIRFTDTDGSTLINYWIESGINSSSTRIWFKIPSISTGTKTVYLYYGNSSATSLSNGDDTFIFFDDFTGTNGTIPNAAKWTRNVTGSGAADIQNNTLRTYIPSSSNGLVNSINNMSPPCIIELSAKASTLWGSNDPWFGLNDYGVLFGTSSGVFQIGAYGSTWTTWSGYSLDTWYRFRLKYTSTTFTVEEDVRANTYTRTITIPAMVFKFGDNQPHVNGKTMYMDDFRVRQYASSEPTTCVGGEEVSTVSWLTNWNRRKLLTISGSTSSQTDYQMKLIVHKSIGTDTSTDIYLGSNINNDFSDLRFTSNNGTTLLSYWIESYTSGSVATVWIKIPSIPISPCTTTIYLYYNNSGASSVSSGTGTFSSFARIPNQNYIGSTTTAKWFFWGYDGSTYSDHSVNDTGQTTSVSHRGSYGPGSGSNSLRWFGTGSNYVYEYSGMEEIHDEVMHLMRLDVPATGDYRIGIQYNYDILQLSSHPATLASIELSSFVSTLPTSGWNQGDWYEMIHTAGSSNLNLPTSFPSNYSISRELNAASIGIKDSRGQILYIGIGVRSQGSNNGQWTYEEIKVDMSKSCGYVRKYAFPEPTFSSIGSEQTSPNITATLMTITPNETPCRHNICTVTVSVTWTNNGGTTGSFIPNITIDATPISPEPYPSQELAPSANVTKTFIISGLTIGTHNICPYPN